MRIFSPAKINLGLRVAHRRLQDGYHYLNSILALISFGDELEIKATSTDEDIFTSQNELPDNVRKKFEQVSERGTPQNNLIFQVLEHTRPFRSQALCVHLRKRIPPGAGLGGGSSNAGVLLRYIYQNGLLSKMGNRACQLKKLHTIGLKLGTDVPFFLRIASGAALVSGVGENIQALKIRPGLGILALASLHIDTSKAYSMLKRPLQPDPPPKSLYGFSVIVQRAFKSDSYSWQDIRPLYNDFEAGVFSLYQGVGRLKNAFIDKGADYALMSGSGSSVYGLVDDMRKQTELKKAMENEFPQYCFIPFHFITDPNLL